MQLINFFPKNFKMRPINDLFFVWNQDKQGGFLMNAIKWNFTKFVVDKEGQPTARFGPTDDPIPKVEDECKKYFWSQPAESKL